MYIAVTQKRYRSVKEVGKITMNVRIIAYYQLMQVCQAEYFRQLLKPSDQQYYPIKVAPPLAHQVGSGYMYNAPAAPALGATLLSGAKLSMPFHGVEFQPSEVCPKNFIIFDQTDNRSRIMFHPASAPKFNCPVFDTRAAYILDNGGGKDAVKDNREPSSPMKENTEDIDALLSLEDDEQEDDDEEVSTARTLGSYGSSSPDSCSNYGPKPRKLKSSSIHKSSSSGNSSNGERKRQRMKKMVKALRGIVPGGKQMNTAAVIDEAVKYLKSLKVEVKKLGTGNFKN
ncbi:hypothetical protein HHK36_001586 [Tetracentron sinense]|uniref:BHLH domain-containing protein n=1 Tax=Tetracentron sinense TaxID=13715 RepID=A0A834ZT36_TETSI|nr:hypothetical protein HHK36_001586 [Tetracentron sinense]